ncbi:unnamed protein product, partial [Pylaiella littoralis]
NLYDSNTNCLDPTLLLESLSSPGEFSKHACGLPSDVQPLCGTHRTYVWKKGGCCVAHHIMYVLTCRSSSCMYYCMSCTRLCTAVSVGTSKKVYGQIKRIALSSRYHLFLHAVIRPCASPRKKAEGQKNREHKKEKLRSTKVRRNSVHHIKGK